MSFELPAKVHRPNSRPSWSGAAFIVEAMLLLVFLIAALAVFTRMFSIAADHGRESDVMSNAIAAASNAAEEFSAHPGQAAAVQQVGDMRVTCDVTEQKRAGGTMYYATIYVHSSASENPLYTISTSRYESEVK